MHLPLDLVADLVVRLFLKSILATACSVCVCVCLCAISSAPVCKCKQENLWYLLEHTTKSQKREEEEKK